MGQEEDYEFHCILGFKPILLLSLSFAFLNHLIERQSLNLRKLEVYSQHFCDTKNLIFRYG
mgnify:CR=1 FL=1